MQSRIEGLNERWYYRNDTVWLESGICKVLRRRVYIDSSTVRVTDAVPDKPAFITVHGNVQYDFLYRSLVDTPYYQNDYSQHSIQSSLDVVVRNSYPLRVTVLSRRSNSPYFRDMTDVNVQFRENMYLTQLKKNLTDQAVNRLHNEKNELYREQAKIQQLYQQQAEKVTQLRTWINSPARIQELVAEKEKQLYPVADPEDSAREMVKNYLHEKYQGATDSIKQKGDSLWKQKKGNLASDSSANKINLVKERLQQKKQELARAEETLRDYGKKIVGFKKNMQDSLGRIKQRIARVKNMDELKEYVSQNKEDAKKMPAGWKALTSIKNLGIGRTWLDYSELTVKNISLSGGNIEINPSRFYFAVAAGRINARFRDFVVRDNNMPRQSLFLIRAGIGKKEKSNLIFTYYNGKRNLLNSFYSSSFSSRLEKVIGISLESRILIDDNKFLTLETAKSSFHSTNSASRQQSQLMKKVWNMKDRSNEAYSIKLMSYWPQTDTRVSGYYRKMGEHFQSFNLQPVNVSQESYQVKVQQNFWRKRLGIEAGIRKNDFSNPFINPGLNSSTVFKSLSATVRIPKYPSLTIGYYPSSQLTVLANQTLVENQYNTLSAVASHSYRVGTKSMSSNAMYLRFYNSGADTGFIYYNATSWSANQYIFWNKLQSQTGFTYTGQQNLKVTTVEQSITWQLRQWLSASAGGKYNRVNAAETLWGGMAAMHISFEKIGTIQLAYDRSYLPGLDRNLLPVDMGKLTLIKKF